MVEQFHLIKPKSSAWGRLVLWNTPQESSSRFVGIAKFDDGKVLAKDFDTWEAGVLDVAAGKWEGWRETTLSGVV